MFFSSAAVPHLVKKAVDGRLTRWPWVETSLTVSPANPLAVVDSLKAVEVLREIGATEEQLKNIMNEIKDAPIIDLTEVKAMKVIKVTCPKCKAEFDYEMPEAAGTPATEPNAQGTEPGAAGDKQPAATNPGVNQGMAPETHVSVEGVDASGNSGQHGGATGAADKPEGDRVKDTPASAEGAKGDTPKPGAMVSSKEPEPPPAATQASDNTATSTGAPPGKAIEVKAEKAESEVGAKEDASKAVMLEVTKTVDSIKGMLAETIKSVKQSVEEVVQPLEERIKALEAQPAQSGPIRRVANPANPLDEKTSGELQKMFDDPSTPPAVKAYIGERLAVDEVSAMIQRGPQRLGRNTAEK